METIRRTWHKIILFFILVITGFLSYYGVGKEGYGNTYYAAAVKSMLMSWHNFFFLSFDPGGYVTIDKPPIAFWLQAASAKLFGFQGWSLILPEALATVVSVALIYHLVQRVFGKSCGLVAAAVLAVTPILVAVSRTNEPDPTLVMVVLFAAWALILAAERSSLKYLVLALGLVGIGFNVKMAEAFLVVPAFYGVYWLYARVKPGRRLGHLALATAVLVVVSLSWVTVVDMTPASMRPYVGSSQTNSELELAVGYNGIQRVLPRHGFTGLKADFSPRLADQWERELADREAGFHVPDGKGVRPSGARGHGGFGMGGGSSGILRLLDNQMAGQISWLLPLAFLGILGAYLRSRRRGADPDESRTVRLALGFWGLWVLPMVVYFSIASLAHLYYMSMLAPGIAALAAIGFREMYLLYRDESGWKAFFLPVALAATAALQVFILSGYSTWSAWLTPVAAGVSGLCALALVIGKVRSRTEPARGTRFIAAAALSALLVAPAVWSLTPMMYGTNASSPTAGPELAENGANGRGFGGFGFGGDINTSKLINFLLRHNGNATYLVAVPNAMTAAPIILQTGKAVMAVGGFMGRDPILTVARLQQMVAAGELRYFMVTGLPGGNAGKGPNPAARLGWMGSQTAVTQWVEDHGTLVPQQEWDSNASAEGSDGSPWTGRMPDLQLYDLSRAAAS
ncbi:Dolichyl-phosphate-mannose-protein mannosyltransferase [Acididesulfobacillus acetoxydans]|uniref:Dolichyl-phosphate-mannose-protein mannosyltransferase n=1 Tax=Acididesulfobacillus acetoxydans TaxID=1561005 RepID=A0A8S0X5W2_9FIRM|nr:glycosyltransferase family 39 protein [Acididesulfobacillus acetoxydans]CAA7601980.1 Dolichyl-phosphate-mannose-protein mannosyltransferase [Acididesulfobacillus acetoxydans]CEJ08176.1 Predicted glycosyltransferase [Acididesulfobacillus acetoxydans]